MGLALDEPMTGDHRFRIEDIRFLVSRAHADALSRHELRVDFLDDRFGRGFHVFSRRSRGCDTPW